LFDRGAKEILGHALRSDTVPAYIVWQDNLNDCSRMEAIKELRVFRNDPRIRFTNPVHESIGESLYRYWPEFVPPELDIHLRHYGYLASNKEGKHERNIALLRQWLQSDPGNIYAYYKLGGTLAELGKIEEALNYLEEAFALFARNRERGSYPFLSKFVALYCEILEARGFTDRAVECREIAAGWS